MGDFSSTVNLFVENAKERTDQVVRATCLKILARLIERSPVGNPDLWKRNQTAVSYNKEVQAENERIRQNPATSTQTRFGRKIKPGRKIHDGMDVKAPPGYTGGRFRGNWQVSFDTPAQGEIDRIDKSGAETLASESAVIRTLKVGMVEAVYFCNNVPYAIPLEFGHSTQAPHGMVRITAREFLPIVNQVAREINK